MPMRENLANIYGAHPVCYYAVTGHLLNDSTHAGIWGIRKMLEFDCPPISREDAGGQPYWDAQEVKIKIEALQDNYAAIKRAILLAQTLQTVVLQYATDYYNFIKNTANPPLVTPNGSLELSFEATLDVSATDIVLTIEYHGKIYPVLWQWMQANASAAVAGLTGGITITGLTQERANDAEYGVPGFIGIYVGTGNLTTDDELGAKEAAGSKFQLKLGKMADTMQLQPITKKWEVNNTIALFQNRVADQQLLSTWSNTEQVVTWQLAQGTTFIFNKCTKLISGPKLTDSMGLIEVQQKGMGFLDPVNGTPTNIIFDDTAKSITINQQGLVF